MGNTVYKLKAFSLCNDEIIYHIWSQQAYELLPLVRWANQTQEIQLP